MWIPVSICLIAAFSESMTEHLGREISDSGKKKRNFGNRNSAAEIKLHRFF